MDFGLALAFPTSALATSWTEEVAKRARPSVVLIACDTGVGTGFAVGPTTIATNYHVVQDLFAGGQCAAYSQDDVEHAIIDIVAYSVDKDLAVFDVSGTPLSPLPLTSTVPNVGAAVLVIGHPEGLPWTASKGIISSVRPDTVAGLQLQTDAAISPGSSGSPMLQEDGRVIGVVRAYLEDGQNLNFAVSVTELLTLVPDLRAPTAPTPQTVAVPRPSYSYGGPDLGVGPPAGTPQPSPRPPVVVPQPQPTYPRPRQPSRPHVSRFPLNLQLGASADLASSPATALLETRVGVEFTRGSNGWTPIAEVTLLFDPGLSPEGEASLDPPQARQGAIELGARGRTGRVFADLAAGAQLMARSSSPLQVLEPRSEQPGWVAEVGAGVQLSLHLGLRVGGIGTLAIGDDWRSMVPGYGVSARWTIVP